MKNTFINAMHNLRRTMDYSVFEKNPEAFDCLLTSIVEHHLRGDSGLTTYAGNIPEAEYPFLVEHLYELGFDIKLHNHHDEEYGDWMTIYWGE